MYVRDKDIFKKKKKNLLQKCPTHINTLIPSPCFEKKKKKSSTKIRMFKVLYWVFLKLGYVPLQLFQLC